MATFTVSGFEIKSGPDNSILTTKAAQLQIVAPIGQATLDFRYVDDVAKTADVSLSNYNLLLDGLHLNDGVLPERVEIFTLQWSTDQASHEQSQVLNLAFSENNQWRDCVFAVGNAPLPNLGDPETAQAILTNGTFSVPDGAELNNGFTLQLEDMPGVEVAGVIQQIFDEDRLAHVSQDRFDFIYNSDQEAPDMTAFDIAMRAQDTNPLAPHDTDVDLPIDPFDPGVDMPSYDDLAG